MVYAMNSRNNLARLRGSHSASRVQGVRHHTHLMLHCVQTDISFMKDIGAFVKLSHNICNQHVLSMHCLLDCCVPQVIKPC